MWSLIPFTKASKEARYVLDKQRLKHEYQQEHERIQQLEDFLKKCDERNPKCYDELLKELLSDSVMSQTNPLPLSSSTTELSSKSFDENENTERRIRKSRSTKSLSDDLLVALRHFQRLKYLEDEQQQHGQTDDAERETASSNKQQRHVKSDNKIITHKDLSPHSSLQLPPPLLLNSTEQEGHDHSSNCTWIGVSETGESLCCINEAILHPWKQYKSLSTGVFLPLSTGFCIFHQKYCLDSHHLHVKREIMPTLSMNTSSSASLINNNYNTEDYSSIHPISLPNRLGLCKECFILDKGYAPPCMMKLSHTSSLNTKNNSKDHAAYRFCHVPGVQRKVMRTKAM